ncbi:MAG: alanine racemase [Bacillota bacterium]
MSVKSTRPVWVDINLENVRHNFNQIKQKSGESGEDVLISPVVKADAYGHGVVPVTKALEEAGADRFAVALPEEGKELRKAGIDLPIHVLGEVLQEQIPLFVEYNLIPTICKLETVEVLNVMAKKKNKKQKVHIKIDTGMGRIGIYPEDAVDFILQVQELSQIKIEGIITHFACADAEDKSYTFKQWDLFRGLINELEKNGVEIPIKHVANSAVVMDLPSEMYMDMLRPGIMIYGLYPSSEIKNDMDLKPALSLKAKIVYLKDVPPGQGISYGATYITSKKTKVATIPLGYADGFSRLLSNKGNILVQGHKVPIIGRVCMDQIMVDVTGIKNVSIGDEVVLIGTQGEKEITADDLAHKIGTINYEIVCNISDRIPRVYY